MLNIPRLVHAYVTGDRKSESGKLWPSALGGCIRREMYRVQGFEPTHPMPAEKRWQLHRYGWYEQPVVEALRWGEYDVETQVSVGNQHWSGKIDALVNHPDGSRAIIEIKSISPYAINKSDLPYQHHLQQAHCYAVLLEPGPERVFIVLSRWSDDDIPTIRQIDVTPTTADLEAARLEMYEYERWYEREDLPPCPYEHPSEHAWNCMSNFWNNNTKSKPWVVQCPYFGHCWPGRVDSERGYFEEASENRGNGLL